MEQFLMADTAMQYVYEEYTLLEACVERDFEAVQAILDDNPTEDELNESDKSGRTPLSHACSGGLLPVVELLSEIPEVDVNLSDKEGNTPIHFAAQAGHVEILKTLISDFKKVRIDQKNRQGMSALVKAAIQGRTRCAKELLYAGANHKVRDNTRKYTAEEWARYCGRRDCAEEIAKFTSAKRFLLNPSPKKTINRSSSEPDLSAEMHLNNRPRDRAKSRSFRRTIKKLLPGNGPNISITSLAADNPLAVVARCVSSPVLADTVTKSMLGNLKRPMSMEHIPTVKVTLHGKGEVG